MNRKFLITGIDGFIGKNLGKFLIERGDYVYGIGKRELKKRKERIYFSEYFNINLLDMSQYVNLFKDVDYIIHLASITEQKRINTNPGKALELNLISILNLIEIYLNSRAKNFIYPSSGKVYGIPGYIPIDENHNLKPTIYLGKFKKVVEEIIDYFYLISSRTFTILRIFNVYGPGQKEAFLIPKIIVNIKNNNNIRLGNVDDKRDYIFIDDLVSCFEVILSNDIKGFNVYNVGTGKSYSAREIVKFIGKILKKKIILEVEEKDRRNLEAKDEKADISLIKKLGWKPKIGIYKGLERMLKSYKLIK